MSLGRAARWTPRQPAPQDRRTGGAPRPPVFCRVLTVPLSTTPGSLAPGAGTGWLVWCPSRVWAQPRRAHGDPGVRHNPPRHAPGQDLGMARCTRPNTVPLGLLTHTLPQSRGPDPEIALPDQRPAEGQDTHSGPTRPEPLGPGGARPYLLVRTVLRILVAVGCRRLCPRRRGPRGLQ